MSNKCKLLMSGLDCAGPELVFNQPKKELSNIQKLIKGGISGKLRSVMPPSISAWLSIITGKSLGSLGLYGFRHRKGNSYHDIWITNPRQSKTPQYGISSPDQDANHVYLVSPPVIHRFPLMVVWFLVFLTPSA